MLRASERHIREAQLFTAILKQLLITVFAVGGTLETDVRGCFVAVLRIMEGDRLRFTRTGAGPRQERAVNDRELKSLAAVNREDLHRVCVGLKSSRPLLLAVFLLSGRDLLASQFRKAVGPSRSADAARWRSWER